MVDRGPPITADAERSLCRAKSLKRQVKRPGIPTVYKGIRMRSRLEACYAAFFDELEWDWAYEPMDLDGWIPDYAIDFPDGIILFEVKGLDQEMDGAKLKVELSGWKHEAIIATGNVDGPTIGAFLARDPDVFLWDDADVFFCLSCGKVSVHAAGGDWRCRRCGCGGGNDHVGHFGPREAWARAMNRTQWQPGVRANRTRTEGGIGR